MIEEFLKIASYVTFQPSESSWSWQPSIYTVRWYSFGTWPGAQWEQRMCEVPEVTEFLTASHPSYYFCIGNLPLKHGPKEFNLCCKKRKQLMVLFILVADCRQEGQSCPEALNISLKPLFILVTLQSTSPSPQISRSQAINVFTQKKGHDQGGLFLL